MVPSGRQRRQPMRIVSGSLRGRPIRTPAGQDTRPTSDRARQAVFNILEHASWAPGLEGLRVIDLFAGSGAMGLEALSRGARTCLFVETSEPALACIRGNLEAMVAQGRVMRQDATRMPPRPPGEAPFDLALLDPPYGKGLGEAALASLVSGGWMAADAIAVLERGAGEATAAGPGWTLLDQRRYGVAQVCFLRAG